MRQMFSIFLLFMPIFLWGQVYLKTQQASFKVAENTKVKVPGHLKNESDQVLHNDGNMTIEGDLIFSGENTNYSGEGILVFQGISNQKISSETSLSIASLQLNNKALLVLETNLSILRTLDLNHSGKIALENYHLNITPQAQIINYDKNSYVATNGTGTLTQEVSSSEVIFPIGNGNYNPVRMQNQGEIDNFSIRIEDGEFEAYNLANTTVKPILNRTWHIHEGQQGGSDVTLSLQWNESQEAAVFNRSESRVIFLNEGTWETDSLFSEAQAINLGNWVQHHSGLEAFNNTAFLVEGEVRTTENTLLIFPNPTSELVTLVWEEYKEGEILESYLYNGQGKVFWSLKGSLEEINQQLNYTLSSSARGIYLLRIKNGLRDFTNKIILIK